MIDGRLFDARTSVSRPARVEIGIDRVVCLVDSAGQRHAPLDSVTVSDRIADIPRRITFADGACFETTDNDAVDAALDAAGRRGLARLVARWERTWSAAAVALAAVALVSWGFVKFGVPALADKAAQAMPVSVDSAIGSQGLEVLDRTLFEPSRLPESRQEELRQGFGRMVAPLRDGHRYRLEFRRGGRVGANALALPSGIIVVTDELVALARSDVEIDAVLAHEVGHVRRRHALRTLLQSAGVAALAFALLGDFSSAASLAAAAPVVLVQAKYSRDFEREADSFARDWLRAHGRPVAALDSMLCRLAQTGEVTPYLSTHPPLQQRAACSSAGS